MRLLADENFPKSAVEALVGQGHDVAWVRNVAPGSSDIDVLARVAREERVLLTFDKDFGELARARALKRPSGVVLFRIPTTRPGEIARTIVDVISSRDDWSGHFSVVEPGRIRMRDLGRQG